MDDPNTLWDPNIRLSDLSTSDWRAVFPQLGSFLFNDRYVFNGSSNTGFYLTTAGNAHLVRVHVSSVLTTNWRACISAVQVGTVSEM
jgi:hypothetical protein